MLIDLLDSVPVYYQQSRSKKDEVTLCCPFCPERGERADDRFRLGLNVGNGMGHCFNCGWKSGSYSFTLRELCRIYGIRRRLSMRQEEPKEKADPLPIVTGLPEGYEKLTNSLSDPLEREVGNYLRKRNITREQVRRHRIGYAWAGPFAGRALFPVIGKQGKIYGCVARAVRLAIAPKYLNTPGIKLLWNAYRPAQIAVVVEGIMDALSVERALGTDERTIAVARLGSTITKLQLDQLGQFEQIIIFPDFDEAGVKGARELATTLLEDRRRVSIVLPKALDDSDPGSKSSDEIRAALAEAKPWSKATEYRLRVAAAKSI